MGMARNSAEDVCDVRYSNVRPAQRVLAQTSAGGPRLAYRSAGQLDAMILASADSRWRRRGRARRDVVVADRSGGARASPIRSLRWIGATAFLDPGIVSLSPGCWDLSEKLCFGAYHDD